MEFRLRVGTLERSTVFVYKCAEYASCQVVESIARVVRAENKSNWKSQAYIKHYLACEQAPGLPRCRHDR